MSVEATMGTGEYFFQRRKCEWDNISSRSTSLYVAFIITITRQNFTELYEKFARKTMQLRFSSYFLSSKSLLFRYSVF